MTRCVLFSFPRSRNVEQSKIINPALEKVLVSNISRNANLFQQLLEYSDATERAVQAFPDQLDRKNDI